MKFVLVVSVILASMFAQAGVKTEIEKVDIALQECLKTESSTAGMNGCLAKGLEDADAILLEKEKAAASVLELTDDFYHAQIARRFLDSQSAFKPFRDANSWLVGIRMRLGSSELTTIKLEAYEMTKSRILQIEDILDML